MALDPAGLGDADPKVGGPACALPIEPRTISGVRTWTEGDFRARDLVQDIPPFRISRHSRRGRASHSKGFAVTGCRLADTCLIWLYSSWSAGCTRRGGPMNRRGWLRIMGGLGKRDRGGGLDGTGGLGDGVYL